MKVILYFSPMFEPFNAPLLIKSFGEHITVKSVALYIHMSEVTLFGKNRRKSANSWSLILSATNTICNAEYVPLVARLKVSIIEFAPFSRNPKDCPATIAV